MYIKPVVEYMETSEYWDHVACQLIEVEWRIYSSVN